MDNGSDHNVQQHHSACYLSISIYYTKLVGRMDGVSYQRKSYSQVLRGYTVGSSYVVILNCMYITLRTSVHT